MSNVNTRISNYVHSLEVRAEKAESELSRVEAVLAEVKKDIFENILGSDLNGYQIAIEELKATEAELDGLKRGAKFIARYLKSGHPLEYSESAKEASERTLKEDTED